MRRKISFLLSLVLVLSMCVIQPAYADTHDHIVLDYLQKTGLVESQNGLIDSAISKDAEEATLRWQINKGSGEYKLVYYTTSINENPKDTTRVELTFTVGKDKDDQSDSNKVRIAAQMYKSDGTAIEFEGYQRKYPYSGEVENTTKSTAYVSELSLPIGGAAVATSAKELSLVLGKNLKVMMITDGQTLKVWTNQINKGYITDFSLYYDDTLEDTQIVFPGLAGSKILSIYLENTAGSGLKDRERPIDASGGEQAGDHPGVKVEFDRPWVRDAVTNKFRTITDAEAEKVKATLNLQTKLEPDNTVKTNQLLVNFNLSNNAKVTGEVVGSEDKSVSMEGTDNNTMCLYFVKDIMFTEDKGDVRKHVIVWPGLEESMVIGGELTLSGNITVSSKSSLTGGTNTVDKEYELNTGNVALNTGYTYLKYTPEQSNPGEVTLQITPYKYKGEVVYEAYAVNGKTTTSIDSSNCLFGTYKFIYDPTYPDRKLEISIPCGAESTFMIKAVLSKETNGAVSQKVYYNINGSNVIVKPYTPQIKEVNNIYVIPEGETNVEAAGFSMAWSIPSEEKLKEMLVDKNTLYYELSLYDSEKANKALIAVFELKLHGDDLAIKQIGHSLAKVKYDPDKQQFLASNVVLKNIDSQYWEKIKLDDGYENKNTYPVIDNKYVDGLTYRIPNSFYLGMRAVLDTGKGLKPSATESELYPITLDKTTDVVPAPSIFNAVKVPGSTDLTFSFDNVSVAHFTDMMLTPANWILKGSNANSTYPGKFEVCLYQASYLDGNISKKNDISDKELKNAVDKQDESKLYIISKPITTTPAAIDFTDDQDALKALRSGKVVQFTYENSNLNGGTNEIGFNGLDPNQAYCVRIRTVLESERNQQDRIDMSLFSKIYGFTTNTVPKPVEPDEEVPPTPKDYTAVARDNSSAILHWKDPEMKLSDTGTLTYEIIRTTEQQIDPSLLSRNIKAGSIIEKEAGKKATLFTSSNYSKKDMEDGLTYELIDEMLQPNTVYFYYIRTVYNNIYSEWIYQPVTTTNIEKPISLKAFNATKTTVDVSFLAKVPTSSLYNTFDFGIAIQGEDSPEWKTVLASSLSTVAVADKDVQEGYNFYAYRITDLTPGKRYNVKVCVIDKTKDKIDGQYQQSLYTNVVYIRTEYDQEQQDKEDKYNEYLDKFDKEVEKLRRKPYWTVQEDTTYKYRADYLITDMGVNNEYTLISESDDKAYYYLPAKVLTKLNKGNTILKIKLGDDEISIRPDTIKDDQEILSEAQELIESNQLEDYYLAISVKKTNYSSKVNNEDPVSKKITIDMELVYMRQEDTLTEADIMEALEDVITSERKRFILKLEDRIDDGKLEDDTLQSIIDEVLCDIEEEHIQKVDRIIDKQSQKNVAVNNIDKAILIVHNSDNVGINGYYGIGGWIKVDVYSTGNTFYIEGAKLGSYIFTGQTPLINIVPEVASYQDFINKYQLTEFFEMDNYKLKVAVSKQQLYGALARVMGAHQGTDYVVFLKNQGVKNINNIGINNPIRQDEAIYVVMQGYEKLHNRSVASIVIKNRQGIQNIGAFQPVYRNYVYAAVELKVVTPNDSRVLPSKQMTGQEIIAMLYKMQQ